MQSMYFHSLQYADENFYTIHDTSLHTQGCQNSDGSRSIGEQSKAVFKNSGSETSIHYSGGENQRYDLLHACLYVCVYVLSIYVPVR